ncbi:Putative uncharacterized protein [Moritella viscosa]|uniref:Uncharacterized protein n=1 Tax=Moritella viscosa TaxID=80854 RepID=A0A090IFF9_9GAMM|nr:HD domain-containing phosphohydrolase [Moritella viscosa]CED58464.1 integral membrane protein, putative two-component signal transducer [Moritella viscosa]SGY82303.1 Putative uncharacterized protein [Moritella viscosa]SHN96365.1 Putative uncharacterized protein [Moritella viscosa]SHN96366.1 Putative uncharacterized protein [Moritella viscosa]SHN96472.1 Putative uncharacterized protein [Moritella viscosa]
MKLRKFSLRFTVGTMFVLATLITGFVAVSLQYHFSKKMAMEHTLQSLSKASFDLSAYIQNLERDASNTARLLVAMNQMFDIQSNEIELSNILAEIMIENSLFYSIYVGSENDDFYQLINLDSSPIVREKLAANRDDRWVVIKITGDRQNRVRGTYYYDSHFVLRDVSISESNYFPTERPWYVAANTDSVFKTKPYLFQHLKITGQTYSLKFKDKNNQDKSSILGIDIVLSSIAEKLSNNSFDLSDISEIESYLYIKSGEIISSSRQAAKHITIPESDMLALTSQQRSVISTAATIKISNQNDWVPLDFSLAGKPQGYAIDLLLLIEEMTGIDFEFINGFSWSELIDKYNNDSLDGLHSLLQNQNNRYSGVYSDPIYEFNFALVTRTSSADVHNYAELAGLKVAILSGWPMTAKLRRDFPHIELIEFVDRNAAFKSVSEGDTDALLDVKPVLISGLSQYFYKNLKLHDDIIDLAEQFSSAFYILLKSEHEDLIPIINAAIANISANQRAVLASKWLGNKVIYDNIMVPYQDLVSLAGLQGHHDQIIDRVIEGEEKLVYISPVKVGVSSEEFFAVVIPKKVIYQKVNEQVKIAIFVTVIFMLLMLPLAWLFGAPIVRPIRQLRIETRKVQERRYDEVQLVDTAIKEVWELSEAMMDMSKDLQQYEAAQKEFLEAFIKLIAQAIDDKSKYTAGHCNRVPELGIMLAEVTEQCDSALFKDFKFANADEKREFRIAAWLHDCGKITTPEYIVDKGTKLEANYNRIHEVRTRFEVLWRDAEITALKQKIALPEHKSSIDAALKEKHKKLIDDFAFIAASNVGGEFMSDDKVARVKALSEQTWLRHFDDTLGLSSVEELVKKEALNPHFPVIEKLLSDKAEHIVERDRKVEFDPKFGIKMDVPEHQYNLGEVYNLTISRGTLTAEDRYKINEHMISTIKMLDNLPFPPELSRVPRYASTHHETLKGTGYPRKLTADDLSIPERILVIADIFEALTASDRPYKKAKPVSVAVDIMYKMALDQHLDIELFRLFLQSGTHIKYAQKYLKSEQIDEIDLSKYLQPEQLGEVDLSKKLTA